MESVMTTVECEWCQARITRPGKPCRDLTEAELRALLAAVRVGAPIDATCVRVLRDRGILPDA
jgi:hypothetical protein